MITAMQISILAALIVMALIAAVNMLSLRSLDSRTRRVKPVRFPLVSVLVPARNEEANIGKCLATLADQDYPAYEVLVLDDNSDDRTGAIVQEWQRKDPRVRYLGGEPLPPGWVGKNFACHQLSLAARGDLLLFVDADTRHNRESIRKGVAAMEGLGADLLTVIPRQVMKSFWENAVLPFLHFTTFCFLPLPLVKAVRDPRLAMAVGQFMLFRRRAYDAIGGHRAVKDVMVEDVWMSRLIKKHGFALRVLDGGSAVSCRMYSSLKGIWHGFSKNLFPGFKFSLPAITLVIFFNFATSVLPFVSLAAIIMGKMPAQVLTVVLAQIGLLMAIRLSLSVRFSMSYAAIPTHPLAMLVVISMAINSVRWVLMAGGSRWKGRAYDFRKRNLVTIQGEQ